MKATAKRERLSIAQACERSGLKSGLLYKLIEIGLLTRIALNPASPTGRSKLFVYADELEKFLEVSQSGMPASRQIAAMKQYRAKHKN